MGRIELLDCTLRDGAYIVDGKFGARQISGVLNKLQQAKVDIEFLTESSYEPIVSAKRKY